ncbi:MAG: LamG-like jellyroll fold domain-containing protein, partial [Candidatus Nitrosotenuis sp.]
YNFQQTTKDESTKTNHGVPYNITYQKEYDYYGYEAEFNGYSSKIEIIDSDDFDWDGEFDIMMWVKWASVDQEFVLARRSTTTNGFSLSVNNTSQGDVRFQIGSLSITSTTSGLNDGQKHFIRICRDENDLITLYIDNVSEGTITSSYDTTSSFNLLIGTDTIVDLKTVDETEALNESIIKSLTSSIVKKQANETEAMTENIVSKLNTTVSNIKHVATDIQSVNEGIVKKLSTSSNYFTGTLTRLRFYKDEVKTLEEATKVFSLVNPKSVLKFGGRITKIDTDLSVKKILAQSYGKILAEADVRGELFTNQNPETIMSSLITNNTSLSFNDRSLSSPYTIESYTADGKLIDIIRDFSTMVGKIFYTTPLEEFVLETPSYNATNQVYTHGGGVIIEKVANDDTQLVNSVIVIGKVFEYSTTETLTGANGIKTQFSTNYKPKSTKVTVNGSVFDYTQYTTDFSTKKIIFNTAPSNGATITAEYSYELPLTVKGTRTSSINEYGIHSKQFNMSWVSTREDAVRFIQSYLNKFREVNKSVSLTFGEPILDYSENDVLHVVNSYLGLDDDLVIKTIAWEYPRLNTVITTGDFRFEFLEAD